MAETWVIKDNAPVDEASYVLNKTDISFTSGGEKFVGIEIADDGATALFLNYYRNNNTIQQPAALDYSSGEAQFYWNAPAYKTLEFDTAPTGELLAWLTKNADKQSDTEYLTRKSELTLVANAIRSKTGSTAQISFPDGYVTEISTLTNTSADTVTADKLLEGVTAHDKSGKQITGTIGELAGLAYTGGAITTPGSGGSYSIPASYIPEDTRYVKGNDETVVNVTIPKTKFGDATAADVVKGKAFSSAEGIAQTGSRAEVDHFQVGTRGLSAVGGNYVFPAVSEDSARNLVDGYVNKETVYNVFVPKSVFGNAMPGNVLNGKTYTSDDGLNEAGTMPNNGAAAIQLSDLTAKSVTAGYYSGGTAKVADAEAAKIIPENIKKGVTILGVAGTMEAGGDYNIAATTNADGTQNLAITDAGGGSSGGSGQQLVNLTITVDPTNAPDEWSLYTYSTHGDEVVLDANNLVSTIPNCIVGGIFAIDASHSADPLTRKGYLDQDTIYPSCVNCLFSINIDASGFISAKDTYPVYLCQIAPDAPAGAEATMTLKFN